MKYGIKSFLCISLFVTSGIFAIEMQRLATTYTTVEAFEKGEGKVCEKATDGCNNCGMKDGKVTLCTKMMCENIGNWKCIKFIKTENLSFLSKNERNEYEVVTNRMDIHYKKIVNNVLIKYKEQLDIIKNKDAKTKNQEVLVKIEATQEKLNKTISADTTMTLSQRKIYYLLKYLHYKIRIIENNLS